MSTVNGYYGTPVAPAQTPGAQPTPVNVAVNNYTGNPAPTGVSVANFNLDAYAPQATAAINAAAPYAPTAIGGLKAFGGTSMARESFAKAANTTRAATKAKAAAAGRGAAFGGIMSAVKGSVLFNGLLSIGINGYKVFTKQSTISDAGAAVTGDVASAAVGGAAGAVASAAGTAMLGTMGVAGFPLTLITLGLGVGGYFIADKLFRNTAFFQSMTSSVKKLLGGA